MGLLGVVVECSPRRAEHEMSGVQCASRFQARLLRLSYRLGRSYGGAMAERLIHVVLSPYAPGMSTFITILEGSGKENQEDRHCARCRKYERGPSGVVQRRGGAATPRPGALDGWVEVRRGVPQGFSADEVVDILGP
jgi:hypothetical protein